MTAVGDSAIIDDQDSSVQYVGSWERAGGAEEFNSTTSFPQSKGDSLTFPFVGTSVQTYVTYTGNPAVFMSIDDGAFTSTFQRPQSESGSDFDPSDPIHHQPLWTDPPSNLEDGAHTLSINLTSDPTLGSIFVDYFIYTISAHTPLQGQRLFIDDRDSRIGYREGWRQFGTDPDFMHTSLGSSTTGNNFTFTFEGVGISFYGGLNSASADQMVQASIAVDDRAPVVFAPGPQPQGITYNNQYFSVDGLKQGTHNMTVTALNNHTVWIDYFLVSPGNISLLAESGEPTTTSSSSEPSSSATTAALVSKHSSSTGAIAGGVVGGIVALAVIAGILFWIRRRKQKSQHFIPALLSPISDYEPAATEVVPSRTLVGPAAITNPPSRKTARVLAPPTSSSEREHQPEDTLVSENTASSSRSAKRTAPSSSQNNDASDLYVDSGIRFRDSRPPPSYTVD